MHGNRWSFKKRSYFIILLAVAMMAFEPDSGLSKTLDVLLQCLVYYQLYLWLFDGIDLARVLIHRKHTMIPGTNKGSAAWASEDDHRRNGQFKTDGVFMRRGWGFWAGAPSQNLPAAGTTRTCCFCWTRRQTFGLRGCPTRSPRCANMAAVCGL